ncbi:MAG: cation transporter [Salana multivorans]|uniref:cation diffusion facilitator family transporter n=1 Tax=Salana multivorans TaxID=120377 RepID=UPI00095DAC8E|nr:cation diffusion facilitator family transporter [Salana multivorans]MBN8883884.1 cation transporter [Salana multivorans]OJX95972.1 MAG: cation transporter [Micrococcales bacterium 73-15]
MSGGHAHGHAHGVGGPATAGQRHRGRLVVALSITLTVMVAELVAAWWSGSLALLADAGHMLSDSAGLAIALVATWLAARPATDRWTFGWQRAEILAALTNGVILTVVGLGVIIEGVRRLREPEPVESGIMLVVGIVGLLANLVALRLLSGGREESLNVRGAYLEVLGDLLGSLAVIVAAVLIATTGWERADAVASLAIGVLIVPRALSLLRDVARVLLEGAPLDVEVAVVREHLERTRGVVAVHDLHAWTITSGVPALSAHVVVEDEEASAAGLCRLLDAFGACLEGHFDVEHSTIQVEPVSHHRAHPEGAGHR